MKFLRRVRLVVIPACLCLPCVFPLSAQQPQQKPPAAPQTPVNPQQQPPKPTNPLETEQGRTGLVVRFVVTERRVIRSIDYPGAKSVTVSEILDRFKERKVGLSVESQYDPNKVQRAAVVLKEFLSERGRQYATVEPQIRQIPPSSLEVTFNVNEGPKVKVGDIKILGNDVMGKRDAIRAMKNSHPIGIPHGLFLENIWARTFDATKLEEDKERLREAYRDKGYFTAKVLDQDVRIRNVPAGEFKVALIYRN